MLLFVLLLSTLINLSNGYSTGMSRMFLRKDMYIKEYNINECLQNIHKIITKKEKYCFLSTVANQLPIRDYPYGSVVGYCLNNEGYPVIAISDESKNYNNIENNNKVSILINEQNTNKKVLFTGTISKIENDVIDYDTYPSEETVNLKISYLKQHPNAGWINYPKVFMYVLKDIKEIAYFETKQKGKISVENYKKVFVK